MADYYTQVSFMLNFKTKDDALAALNRLEIMESESEEGEFYTGCLMALEDNSLWIRSDENANLECLVDWIQIVMQRMNWTEPVCFTWANTCSKMHLDSFDGGAVVITQTDQYWMNSDRWARNKIKEIQLSRWAHIKKTLRQLFRRNHHECS
jgi:hypothetical protein